MRRKDKEVTDKNVLHSVINKTNICRIGLVKEDRPYIVPLNFGFDGKHLFFHSARSGEKVEILKMNNNVCVEFEQDIRVIEGEKPCNWSAHYLTVIVHGTADLVVDPDEKRYGLNQVVSHYSGGEFHQFTEEELNTVLVYRINIGEMIGKVSGKLI